MYLEQFKALDNSETNDDLETLNSFQNCAYAFGKYWYSTSARSGNYIYGYIYSVNGLTGTTTLEETRTLFTSAFLDGFEETGIVTKFVNSVLYSTFGFKIHISSPSQYQTYIISAYSSNGTSWNQTTEFTNTGIQSHPLYDVFEMSGNIYVFFSSQNDLYFKTTPGGTLYNQTAAILPDTIHRGNVNGIYYYFLNKHASSFMSEWQFSGTSITENGNTEASVPVNFDTDVQLYNKKGNVAFIMNQDYFETRINSGSWRSFSDTGSDTNGIIWAYDTDSIQVANNVIWKDAIYNIISGTPEKLQNFTGDAFVGWKTDNDAPWFSDGTDTIYQSFESLSKDTTTFKIRRTSINYNKGEMTFIDFTTTSALWVKNEYISTYTVVDSTTYDLFQGKIKDIVYENFLRKIIIKAPWVDDIKQSKVTATYSGKTANYILTDVINNYTAYCNSDIESSTTTYNISYKNKTVKDIIRTLCQAEGWIWYVGIDQTIYANDGTTDTGIAIGLDLINGTTTDRLINVDFKKNLQEVSIVNLLGGYDGSTRIEQTYQKSDAVNSRIYRDNYPEITSTTDLYNIAKTIGDSLNTEIFQTSFSCFNKPPLQFGEQIEFIYTPFKNQDSSYTTTSMWYVIKAGYLEDTHSVQLTISDSLLLDIPEGDSNDGITANQNTQLLDSIA